MVVCCGIEGRGFGIFLSFLFPVIFLKGVPSVIVTHGHTTSTIDSDYTNTRLVGTSVSLLNKMTSVYLNSLQTGHQQEPMTRSLQLYCVRVTAFSQTDLFLD